MPADYEPVPTSSEPTSSYPPLPGPLTHIKQSKRRRLNIGTILKYAGATAAGIVILHYVLLGAFPSSQYTTVYRSQLSSWGFGEDPAFLSAQATAADVLSRLDPTAGQPGTFYRDSRPIKTALAFWDLAEKEVAARNLDTCRGQLSREFINAYHRSELAYCVPPDTQTDHFEMIPHHNATYSHTWVPEAPIGGSYITCSPVRGDQFSMWWPYPSATCLSTNLRAVPEDDRKFYAVGCKLTEAGAKLRSLMGKERFIGSDMERIELDDERAQCKERIERNLLVIGRQDQWNPFHAAEDFITTIVTMFIAAQTSPELVEERLQLVFAEGYGMDSNHFTPIWDRMGAWAPRRLSLDPWGDGVCLTNVIHSVGAGASLLSAMGVGRSYTCASTITWAASHYYRHLFGLLPTSLTRPANLVNSHHSSNMRRPINVLWLSRAKLDAYAMKHNDWSQWRDVRHITNEPELINRLRDGLADLCDSSQESSIFGPLGCQFEDAQDVPETWASTLPDSISDEDPLPVRFATIDPTVHAIETQLHFVGHTTILLSSHGGALGLSLFLPPGEASIIELQVGGVHGNFHFQHMAYEMGHGYEVVSIDPRVNVEDVWSAVLKWVKKNAFSG